MTPGWIAGFKPFLYICPHFLEIIGDRQTLLLKKLNGEYCLSESFKRIQTYLLESGITNTLIHRTSLHGKHWLKQHICRAEMQLPVCWVRNISGCPGVSSYMEHAA
jgi:hypothetical protein